MSEEDDPGEEGRWSQQETQKPGAPPDRKWPHLCCPQQSRAAFRIHNPGLFHHTDSLRFLLHPESTSVQSSFLVQCESSGTFKPRPLAKPRLPLPVPVAVKRSDVCSSERCRDLCPAALLQHQRVLMFRPDQCRRTAALKRRRWANGDVLWAQSMLISSHFMCECEKTLHYRHLVYLVNVKGFTYFITVGQFKLRTAHFSSLLIAWVLIRVLLSWRKWLGWGKTRQFSAAFNDWKRMEDCISGE